MPSLLFYGVGLILGAGIYSIVGAAAGLAGPGLWASFLVASIVALCTGLSYAELAAMHPKAGADYVYAKHAFPRLPLLAALTGFLLAASAMATAATVATAFGGYFGLFLDVPAAASAAALLVLATAINVIGIRQSSWANAILTLVEVAGLLLVILLGLAQPDLGKVLTLPEASGLMAAAGLVFFAFLGFEDIANLAEEARNPKRDAPRAILLSIAISTVLYVLVAVAAVLLASPQDLADSKAPLATAVENVHPRFGTVLGAIALFATGNTCLVALIAASRMLFGVARGGDAPRPLSRVLPSRGTPWIAALVAFGVALLLLPLGSAAVLGSISSLAALGAFVLVNASLLRLRYTQPQAPRPFRVPLAIGRMPITPVVGILGAVAFAAWLPRPALLWGTILATAAFVVLLVAQRLKRRKAA